MEKIKQKESMPVSFISILFILLFTFIFFVSINTSNVSASVAEGEVGGGFGINIVVGDSGSQGNQNNTDGIDNGNVNNVPDSHDRNSKKSSRNNKNNEPGFSYNIINLQKQTEKSIEDKQTRKIILNSLNAENKKNSAEENTNDAQDKTSQMFLLLSSLTFSLSLSFIFVIILTQEKFTDSK